jgi:hypothetical protein
MRSSLVLALISVFSCAVDGHADGNKHGITWTPPAGWVRDLQAEKKDSPPKPPHEVMARYQVPDGCYVLVFYEECNSPDLCEGMSYTPTALAEWVQGTAEFCITHDHCTEAPMIEKGPKKYTAAPESAEFEPTKDGFSRGVLRRKETDLVADVSVFQLQLTHSKRAMVPVRFMCTDAGYKKHKAELDAFVKSFVFRIGKVTSEPMPKRRGRARGRARSPARPWSSARRFR